MQGWALNKVHGREYTIQVPEDRHERVCVFLPNFVTTGEACLSQT